jgi:hypothetical protein
MLWFMGSLKPNQCIQVVWFWMMTVTLTACSFEKPKPPALVVFITVDGLRSDLLSRYRSELTRTKGFEFLLKNGIQYSQAFYPHAHTARLTGHSSLATGAPPSIHGMIGDVWFDRRQKLRVFGVEDSTYAPLHPKGFHPKMDEVSFSGEHTYHGSTPLALKASTLSDELRMAYGRQSKIFSVAMDSRAAVPLAGQTGLAYWFSKQDRQFVTSNYYLDTYPKWVTSWRDERLMDSFEGSQWKRLNSQASSKGNQRVSKEANDSLLPGYGIGFPYTFPSLDDPAYTKFLYTSPAADTLTLNFATQLLKREGLGQDDVPDFLAVSFSSLNAVAHLKGISSVEVKDIVLRLDQKIALFLQKINEQVGLKRTLIVLTAAHGMPESVVVAQQRGLHNSAYFDPDQLKQSQVFQPLLDRYQLGSEVVTSYDFPHIYLNRELIRKRGLALETVQQILAASILRLSGVLKVMTSTQLEQGNLPQTALSKKVMNSFDPERSGDLHVILEPRRYLRVSTKVHASKEGSPWHYDTHVPLIVSAYRYKSAKVTRPISLYSIAPTLAQLLKVSPPSGSVEVVLDELLID